MRSEVAPTPTEVGVRGAAILAEWSQDAIAARGRFTIALAGGEGPRVLYEALAARTDIDFARWVVLWGDERVVPRADPRSNAANARAWLLSRVAVPPNQVHEMVGDGSDAEALAEAYEAVLARELGIDAVIDCMLLGIGKDAHTLSLHPHCAAIAETRRTVVGLRNPPMDPAVDRVTLTPRIVRDARHVMVVAHGANKRGPLRAVLEGDDDRMGVPAQIVRDARGEVVLLLDDAAAR